MRAGKPIRNSRLKKEFEDVRMAFEEFDQDEIDKSVKAIWVHHDREGLRDYSTWYFVFKGREDSHLSEGTYKMQIVAGDNYPYEPPEVTMMDGFEHYHVFTGGKVCFRYLSKENWRIELTITRLANQIIKMLNSPPQVKDPASQTLPHYIDHRDEKYVVPNLNRYYEFLRNQGRKFANRYQPQIKRYGPDVQMS